MNLVALTDRPAVPHFPQWVRLDLECERVNFGHRDIMRQRRLARQTIFPSLNQADTTPIAGSASFRQETTSIANFRYQ
jgi:hypothetical protein